MEGRDFSAYVVIYDSDENTNRSTIQMSNIMIAIRCYNI